MSSCLRLLRNDKDEPKYLIVALLNYHRYTKRRIILRIKLDIDLMFFLRFIAHEFLLDNLISDYHLKGNTERVECLINDVGQVVCDSVLKYAECLE